MAHVGVVREASRVGERGVSRSIHLTRTLAAHNSDEEHAEKFCVLLILLHSRVLSSSSSHAYLRVSGEKNNNPPERSQNESTLPSVGTEKLFTIDVIERLNSLRVRHNQFTHSTSHERIPIRKFRCWRLPTSVRRAERFLPKLSTTTSE